MALVGDRLESDLAAEAMAGGQDAFGRLVKVHQSSVRALCRRLTRSASDADDIAQAAFMTAWRRRSTWRGGSFKGWVCMIAYREFLHARPDQDRGQEGNDLEDGQNDAPGERMDLARAMAGLEPNERHAIALCLGSGLSHTEAAEVMQASLGSVKSWVLRGRAKLREALAAYEEA
jgi:RNA polymerase sigma factor (sigma-70 family)